MARMSIERLGCCGIHLYDKAIFLHRGVEYLISPKRGRKKRGEISLISALQQWNNPHPLTPTTTHFFENTMATGRPRAAATSSEHQKSWRCSVLGQSLWFSWLESEPLPTFADRDNCLIYINTLLPFVVKLALG